MAEQTFTDSKGRSTKFFFILPPGHDPTIPTGVLMYFHGNDLDPDDSYIAPLTGSCSTFSTTVSPISTTIPPGVTL